MKTKYLFGMLLSGALLAACTADDDLNAPIAQEANPAAPVFTVHLDKDGNQNRAEFTESGWKVTWNEDDLLSLYHGIPNLSNLSGWQNAIYKGKDLGDGEFEFTTQSMVGIGKAVMLFPAKLDFEGVGSNGLGNDAPLVTVPQDQDETTKDETPYMSEILDIAEKAVKNGTDAVAGYGNEYDITLRRAAGTLTLNLETSNAPVIAGVDPIEITAVELISDNESFTTSIPVVATSTAVASKKANPSWVASSALNADAAEGEESINTTDVVENKVATFTLLPIGTGKDLSNCTVKVYTTYGTVTIAADAKPWSGNTLKDKTVTTGLAEIYKALFGTATSGTFKNEWVGKHASATIKVDLSKVELDGMHIQNQDQLKVALKVYDALYDAGDAVNLFLDGKTFTMGDDAWSAAVAHMGKGVTFTPCTEDGPCGTIKLETTGEKEIPNLQFEGQVDVQLAGKWKYSNVTGVSGDSDKRKTLKNVKKITVLKNATITLSNYIAAKQTVTNGIEVAAGATAIASGEAILQMTMNNFGTITIGKEDLLRAGNDGRLYNREAQGDDATGWDDGAVINNAGVLGIVDKTSGYIYNYGIINVKEATARTLISSNGDIASLYDNTTEFTPNTNRIGTINLYSATTLDDSRTNVWGNQGFIKIKVSATDAKKADFGEVANYVILTGNCEGVKVDRTYKDGVLTADNNLPTNIQYIEISNSKEVKFTGQFSLTGLFVRNNSVVDVPKASYVYAYQMYLSEGKVYRTGTFYYNSLEGYFGGDTDEDAKNITTFL